MAIEKREKREKRNSYRLTPKAYEALEKLNELGFDKAIAVSLSLETVGENPDFFKDYFNRKISAAFSERGL